MSDPQAQHVFDPRVGTTYVPARYAQMRCDHIGCRLPPLRAPVLVVPLVPFTIPGPRPIRMYNTMHFCERHKAECTVELILVPKVKADIEAHAKRRTINGEYKADFEAAHIDWILVTTPEYRAFLTQLELGLATVNGVPVQ
jgi:hypothetical protein